MKKKSCPRCKAVLPLSQFKQYLREGLPTINTYCKTCQRRYNEEYNRQNEREYNTGSLECLWRRLNRRAAARKAASAPPAEAAEPRSRVMDSVRHMRASTGQLIRRFGG
jgi:hypothetical protein